MVEQGKLYKCLYIFMVEIFYNKNMIWKSFQLRLLNLTSI